MRAWRTVGGPHNDLGLSCGAVEQFYQLDARESLSLQGCLSSPASVRSLDFPDCSNPLLGSSSSGVAWIPLLVRIGEALRQLTKKFPERPLVEFAC